MTVPAEQSRDIKAIARLVIYGWGVIPVRAWGGATEWQTSLFSHPCAIWQQLVLED